MQLLAQKSMDLPPINQGAGGLGGFSQITSPGDTAANILSILLGFLTIIAGLWFLTNFVLGAVSWISAGGDKGKAQQARDKLTNAVIGLAIVVGAYAIAGLVGTIVGIDFLNIGAALSILTPGGAPPAP